MSDPISADCPSCGGQLRFFEPTTPRPGVDPASLPAACKSCHGIFLEGVRLELPEAFEKKATNLAIEASKAAQETTSKMKVDPELRVESYLVQTFKLAYMKGFFRAMAYYQHLAKEGRLIRLSRLWSSFRKSGYQEGEAMVIIPMELYSEFDTLLKVRTKEIRHGQGDSHEQQPGEPHEAPVQGPARSTDRG